MDEILQRYVDKWIKIALSPQNADMPSEAEVQAAFEELYQVVGKPVPLDLQWHNSPASVRASVWDSVWASVWASVRASVRDSVRDSVRASVWDSVRASVWASVRDSAWASVRDSVRDSVWASVWDSVRDSAWASVRDSVWAIWLDYLVHEKGIESLRPYLPFLKIIQGGALYIGVDNQVLAVKRSVVFSVEGDQLHNATEAAVQWADGTQAYFLRGLTIEPKWFEEAYTAQAIFDEDNTEIQRVLIEQYGIQRYMAELGMKPIYQDVDRAGYPRYLWHYADPSGDKSLDLVTVQVTCPSTHKEYASNQVPPYPDWQPDEQADNPRFWRSIDEAIAWRFGLQEDQYKPVRES